MIQKVRIELPEEVKTGTGEHPFCANGVKIFIDDKQIHNTIDDIVVRYPVRGPVTVTLTILVTDGSGGVEFDGYAEIEKKRDYVDVTPHEKSGKDMPRVLLESKE